MRDIEHILGISLLRRTGRGAVLTDAGVRLLPKLRALVAVIEDARSFRGRPSGVVQLSVLASLGPFLMTPLLNRAMDALSGVPIESLQALTDHLEGLLVARAIA